MPGTRKGRKRTAAPPPRRPDDPRLQQAVTAINGRHFQAASALLDEVLRDNPQDANAHNLLGVTALELGQPEAAVGHLDKAAHAQPKNPFFAYNLGRAHLAAQSFDKAASALKKATRLKPDFAAAHALRGDALRAADRRADAREAYATAISLQPGLVQAHHGLGLVHLRDGDHREAAGHFATLLSRLPEQAREARAAAHANLGLCLARLDRQPEALSQLLEAVDGAPDNAGYRHALVAVLRNTRAVPEAEKLQSILLLLLQQDDVNPRSLSAAVQSWLRARTGIPELFASLGTDPGIPPDSLAPWSDAIAAVLADDVVNAFLASAPVTDVSLEILVTLVRRALLTAVVEPGSTADELCRSWTRDRLALAAVLARQGWLNEYVAYVTPAERDALGQLRRRLAGKAAQDEVNWEVIALIACYEPLYGQDFEIPRSGVPGVLAPVIAQQIADVIEESEMKSQLATLGELQDRVSLAVQDQYEKNPYPRWTRYDIGEPVTLARAVQADLPHIAQSECPQAERPRILIAGCGTGLQTMKAATRYRDASILAIDLSRASLAYGIRMLRRYHIDSVEHLHADILDLDQVDETFDLVESYGVIHHMADTGNALRILADRLRPGGLMYLGLYSQTGRQSIVRARDLIARRGYPRDDSGIREARRDIMRDPDPALAPLLSPASDFWTLSDIRDLIFHVHEHRFTLPEIGAMLAACGLEFLGLALRNPADRIAFAREFPRPEAARDIGNWHLFEQRHPETFGDTYKIWAKKR